jgi:hypothetical protein
MLLHAGSLEELRVTRPEALGLEPTRCSISQLTAWLAAMPCGTRRGLSGHARGQLAALRLQSLQEVQQSGPIEFPIESRGSPGGQAKFQVFPARRG